MAEPRRKTDVTRPNLIAASMDREIATLARRQYGVVAVRQLTALGLSPRACATAPRPGGCTASTTACTPSAIPCSPSRGH
jgi:hypothetical protein